jgi:hypothetical protein
MTSVEKLKEIRIQMPNGRVFSCCGDKFHDSDRMFVGLEQYVVNYNIAKGMTEEQAEMALLFIKQHPDFVIVQGGIDFWIVERFVSKLPPVKVEVKQ